MVLPISGQRSINASIQLRVNEQGLYSLKENIFTRPGRIEILDGSEKIAELNNQDGDITLNIFTDKKFLLSSDIKAKKLQIHAGKSAISIDGAIDCCHQFSLDSSANIEFMRPVCAQNMVVETTKKLKLFESINVIGQALFKASGIQNNLSLTANDLSLSASSRIINNGKIKVGREFLTDSPKFDQAGSLEVDGTTTVVATEHYVHGNQAETIFKGPVRLETNLAQIAGRFSARHSLSLLIKELNFGDETQTPTLIDCPGATLVIVDRVFLRARSQVTLGGNFAPSGQQKIELNSEIRVSEILDISPQSTLSIKGAQLSCENELRNSGELLFERSNVLTKKITLLGGKLRLRDLTSFKVEGDFLLPGEANLNSSRSQINAEKLDLQGKIFASESNFWSSHIHIASPDATFLKSQLNAKQRILINGKYRLGLALIIAPYARLYGDAEIDRARLEADHAHIELATSNNYHLAVDAKEVLTLASKSANKETSFSSCQFRTKSLRQKGLVTLKDSSSIVGTGNETNCHFIHGNLNLDRSKFSTQGFVYTDKDSTLQLTRGGVLETQYFHAKGKTQLSQSTFFSTATAQFDSKLCVTEQSTLSIAQQIFTASADIEILSGSSLHSKKTDLRGHLRVENAALSTEEVFFACIGSDLSTDRANLNLGLATLQKTTLSESQLKAKKLVFRDVFKASRSLVQADQTRITAPAQVNLEHSQAELASADVFGSLAADLSTITLTNNFRTRYGSKTTLTESRLDAESLDHYGDLTVSTNVTVAADGKKQKRISQLQVKHQAKTYCKSTIQGDDLATETDLFVHEGHIALRDSLAMRGGELINSGAISASEQIFLGYDRGVSNQAAISTKLLSVQTSVMANLFGLIHTDSYSCSALANVSTGLLFARSSQVSSFASLGGGLVLPNFTSGNLFSRENALAFARIVGSAWRPNYMNSINFALTSLPALKSYWNAWWAPEDPSAKPKTWRMHEVVGQACQIKTMAMFGAGLMNSIPKLSSELGPSWESLQTSSLSDMYRQVAKVGSYINDAPGNLQNLSYWRDLSVQASSRVSSLDWREIGSRTLGMIGSNHVEDNVFSVHAGVHLAQNAMTNSFYSANFGANAALQTQFVNSYFGYLNAGVDAARELIYSVNGHYHNSGLAYGHSSLNLTASTATNTRSGRMIGRGGAWKIEQVTQQGETDLSKTSLAVKEWHSTKTAQDDLKDSSLQGINARLDGHLRAAGIVINLEKSFSTGAASRSQSDKMTVTAAELTHAGEWEHQNGLALTATTLTSTASSRLTGSVTAPTPNDQPTAPGPHLLVMNSDHIDLSGQQHGGDATILQGEILAVAQSADVTLHNPYLALKRAAVDGKLALKNRSIANIDHTTVSETGELDITGTYRGTKFTSSGLSHFTEANIQQDELRFSKGSKQNAQDTFFDVQRFHDSGQMTIAGQTVVVGEHYQHDGRLISSDPSRPSLFAVDAQSADLRGSAALQNGSYYIHQSKEMPEFLAGRGNYAAYQFSDCLGLGTDQGVRITDSLLRSCNLELTAASIDFLTNHTGRQSLALNSLEGDVNLFSDISANRIDVNSARALRMNGSVYADTLGRFTAQGHYYNFGGKIDANLASIEAAAIHNLTGQSEAAKSFGQYKFGSNGIINGRSQALLNATQGDIENAGGIIHGGDYAQLLAKHSVYNLCNERSYQGKYDQVKEYHPAIISGGLGTETTAGVGLHIRAGDKIIADAADFISKGGNVLDALNGIQFKVRHHTYVSREEYKKSKGFFAPLIGRGHYYTDTATVSRGVNCVSENGRNTFLVREGEFHARAANFLAADGTDLYAKGDINLLSLRTQNKSSKETKSWWGLSHNKRKEIIQQSTPSFFVDNGNTHIVSELGDVDARATLFIGQGDLTIHAGKRILLGRDLLTHQYSERSRGFSISTFGVRAYQSFHDGGSFLDILASEDSSIAKFNALYHANSVGEASLDALNLGINLYNTANSMMRGLANGNLGQEVLARYGLGDGSGFNPTITLTYTDQRTKTQYQTLGMGGIDRRNVGLSAKHGVILSTGVTVRASENITVDTPKLSMYGATLKTIREQYTYKASIGVTAMGNFVNIGASYAHSRSEASTHENARLIAGKHTNLRDVGEIDGRGANFVSKTIALDINKVRIETLQDRSSSSSQSLGINSSGHVNVGSSTHFSARTNQVSGIHVAQINDGDLQIGELHSVGAAITSDGTNHTRVGLLIAESIHDYETSRGLSVAGNISDLERLSPSHQVTNTSGEAAIASVQVETNSRDFAATRASVIAGTSGAAPIVNQAQGLFATSPDAAYHIKRDRESHLQLDIPLTTAEHLRAAQRNFRAGAALFKPACPSTKIPKAVFADFVKSDEKISSLLEKAELEQEQNAAVSEETQQQIKDAFTESLLKLTKQAAEVGWDRVIEGMGTNPKGVSLFFNGTEAFLSFGFNFALSGKAPAADKMQDAALQTANDMTIGFVLSKVFPKAAGSITWALLGAEILDDLTYDPVEQAERWKALGDSASKLRQANGVFEFYKAKIEMDRNRELAMSAAVTHEVAEVSRALGRAIEFCIEHAPDFRASPIENAARASSSFFAEQARRDGAQSLPRADLAP